MTIASRLLAVIMAAVLTLNVAPAFAQQHRPGGWHNGPNRCEDYWSPRDRRDCEQRQRPRPDPAPDGDEIGAAIGAGIIGLTLGAILVGAANENEKQKRIQLYDRWMEYCSGRYRSFDARTETFLGFDGRRHACQLP